MASDHDRPSTTARDILRRLRRQQRLTQVELAGRAGVSQTVIARYESGRQQPTVATLERLLAACGYELDWTIRHLASADSLVSSGRRRWVRAVRLHGLHRGDRPA